MQYNTTIKIQVLWIFADQDNINTKVLIFFEVQTKTLISSNMESCTCAA